MAYDSVAALVEAGISFQDATALRRISMALHRWHELECGSSDNHKSYSVVRGKKVGKTFEYDDNGTPFLEVHFHQGESKAQYWPTPDRERGALKRLDAIIDRYPGFVSYVQDDPRGASLYILRPTDLEGVEGGANGDVGSVYTRGIAVCK